MPQPPRPHLGIARQFEIYQSGLNRAAKPAPVSLSDWKHKAQELLDPAAFDYIAGGAGSEQTMQSNLEAFEHWFIVPRMCRDVTGRDLCTDLFGSHLPAPVLLAPVGVQSIIHADAEIATARAAASLGLPFVLSTASSRSIEQVAAAMGAAPRWFQLYPSSDPNLNASLLRRAQAGGYSAVVVTLDTRILGWRERDLGRAYLPFLRGEGLANYFSDPVFLAALKVTPQEDPASAIGYWSTIFSNAASTWEDLRILRDQTPLPILLKGIIHADDARQALDYGVDGVIVSNHGGRQVDGALGALDALPAVAKAVGARVPVLFDSGIRRGADIVKALALGARAVLVGRPYCWGLGAAGEQGVREVMINLLADFDVTAALCGLTGCGEIDMAVLCRKS